MSSIGWSGNDVKIIDSDIISPKLNDGIVETLSKLINSEYEIVVIKEIDIEFGENKPSSNIRLGLTPFQDNEIGKIIKIYDHFDRTTALQAHNLADGDLIIPYTSGEVTKTVKAITNANSGDMYYSQAFFIPTTTDPINEVTLKVKMSSGSSDSSTQTGTLTYQVYSIMKIPIS